ncbi:B12-binding domain-containing radical SAM protein [bacterium]|nr:B12-binding domain-containing radical SAM protein [bacterium]
MKKPERALFIVPPTGRFIREDRCQTPIEKLRTVALRPPIDLMYAAACFEQEGVECRLVDYPGEEWGWERLEADLREFKPNALILSITTPSFDDDMKAATLAKKVDPSITTIAKGAHFNTLDVQSLERFPDLDLALRGEYEMTCLDLARGMETADVAGVTWRDGERIVRNPARGLPDNLDEIPFPARHLGNNALYIRPDVEQMQTTLVTNRGCPFSCTYCLANQVSGLKNRYRSVENVMAEIRECVHKFGIRNFLFRSDLFTQNKKWVIRLCQSIIDEGLDISWASNSRVDTVNPEVLEWMKKAGCWIIAFGVEKGDDEALEKINKKATVDQAREALRITREAGIKRSMYLLFGLPDDDRDTLQKDIDFAKEVDPDFLEIFYPYPFPGTALYEEAVSKGLLTDGEIPKEAYGMPAMPTTKIPIEELARLRTWGLRRFYMRPRFVARTLMGVSTMREFKNFVKYGAFQLKDIVVRG